MKIFFFFFEGFNLDFEAKISLRSSQNCLYPQERYTGAGPTTGTMLTKPTKSARPDKPTVSIMPTLPSSPAMTRDLAYYAYTGCP